MTYLKIFPKSIVVKRNDGGAYAGHITYDFEQYGRMFYGDEAEVEFRCHWESRTDWEICSPPLAHQLVGFSVFMQALNHYLFQVVHFDPISQWNKKTELQCEYYFDRVYFDMDTQSINSASNASKGLLCDFVLPK